MPRTSNVCTVSPHEVSFGLNLDARMSRASKILRMLSHRDTVCLAEDHSCPTLLSSGAGVAPAWMFPLSLSFWYFETRFSSLVPAPLCEWCETHVLPSVPSPKKYPFQIWPLECHPVTLLLHASGVDVALAGLGSVQCCIRPCRGLCWAMCSACMSSHSSTFTSFTNLFSRNLVKNVNLG